MNDKHILEKILHKLFENEFKEEYSIIKLNPNFPDLKIDSDLDLLVKNKINFIRELDLKIRNLNMIKIKLKHLNDFHSHYDILKKSNSSLFIRIDIYSRLPNFEVVKVKNILFENILNNSIKKVFSINSKKIKIKIPNFYFDLILRYIEYYEFFWTGNPKDQHILFIKNTLLNSQKKQREFLEYINHYTELPLDFHQKYSNQIQKYKKSTVTKYYIKKILSRFFKINL